MRCASDCVERAHASKRRTGEMNGHVITYTVQKPYFLMVPSFLAISYVGRKKAP